jgi:hypothetical protein
MNRKKNRNNRGITSGVSSSTLGILNFTSAFILLGAGTGNIVGLLFMLLYLFNNYIFLYEELFLMLMHALLYLLFYIVMTMYTVC